MLNESSDQYFSACNLSSSFTGFSLYKDSPWFCISAVIGDTINTTVPVLESVCHKWEYLTTRGFKADSESFVLKNQSEGTEKKNSINNIDFKKNGWEGERRGIDHRSIFRLTDLMQHILTYCIFKVNMFRPGIPVHIYQGV